MKKILLIILSAILLCGCGSSKTGRKPKPTKGNTYTQIYVEQPKTLAVLPPADSAVENNEISQFHRSVYLQLAELEYDIVPLSTMMNKLQEAGLVDSSKQMGSDCSVYKSCLGADAVLFTNILRRERNNEGDLVVSAEYLLKSTTTGQDLYHRVVTVVKPTSSVSVGHGVSGALLSFGLTKLRDAVTTRYDELDVKCNELVFKNLPFGPRHGRYNTDQTDRIDSESIEYTFME